MNRIVGYRLSGRRVLAIGKCAQCTILELLRRISGPVAELPQCWVSQPVCVRVSQHWVKRLPSSLNLFTYTLFCPYQMSTCSWWLHHSNVLDRTLYFHVINFSHLSNY